MNSTASVFLSYPFIMSDLYLRGVLGAIGRTWLPFASAMLQVTNLLSPSAENAPVVKLNRLATDL